MGKYDTDQMAIREAQVTVIRHEWRTRGRRKGDGDGEEVG